MLLIFSTLQKVIFHNILFLETQIISEFHFGYHEKIKFNFILVSFNKKKSYFQFAVRLFRCGFDFHAGMNFFIFIPSLLLCVYVPVCYVLQFCRKIFMISDNKAPLSFPDESLLSNIGKILLPNTSQLISKSSHT